MKTFYLSPNSKDLVIEGGQFKTIDGRGKLEQDLRCIIMERFNSDPYISGFGSTFSDMIGDDYDPSLLKANITTEVLRVLHSYQTQQLRRLDYEKWQIGSTDESYMSQLVQSRSELIDQIRAIEVDIRDRRAYVSIVVTTKEQDEVELSSGQIVLSLG